MQMSKALASLLALTAAASLTAQATPIRLNGRETNLQQIVNGMTVGGVSSVDVVNDQYADNEQWQIDSVFARGDAMIVMELAGYAGVNRFGLYDINNASNRLQLFSGADGRGAATQFSIDAAGNVYRNSVFSGQTFASDLFGFYLETPAGLWFSQTSLNSDNADHLVALRGEGDIIRSPLGRNAYWGSDTYLLAWEDLSARNWDQDYNDFVVFIGGASGVGVPEPATMGLLGLGLAGIGVFGRRRTAANR